MSKASLELGGTNWAAKDGNLLGYANGSFVDRYIPREFTFSRGSNLAATRVNSAGKIEKGRENLLKRSNDFSDVLWVQASTTRTSGQTGYDGSSDAWEVTRASGGSVILYQAEATSGVNTFSVYVKVNASNGFGISFDSSSYAYFDISDTTKNGAVATSAIVTSSQTYIGNNFYRLSVTASGGFSQVRFTNCIADGTTADSSGGTHIIQDAQLEVGTIATDYIESGATTATAGLLENEPRIDYTDGTPSLLLEPSRTNLITNSEYIGISDWSVENVMIEHNSITSPENQTNAAKLTGNGGFAQRRIYKSFSQVSGQDFTTSIFAKADTENILFLRLFNATDNVYANASFNLSTGAINSNDSGTAKIENYGNGWYRCILTGTPSTTTTTGGAYFNLTSDGNTTSTTSLYLWGAQLEAGSYPTSYIPNHSGGSVTRLAESFSATGFADYLGDSEGTIFIEGEMSQKNGYISLIEGTNSGVSIGVNGGGQFFYIIRDSGSTQGEIAVSNIFTTNTNFKIAGKYKTNDFELFKDGASIGTDTTGNTFGDGDLITINSNSVFPADQPFYGRIKQILVFPAALSAADCITLTT